MPADVLETDTHPETVQGPAGGDPRTAASVRAMGSPLASRTRWARNRIKNVLGNYKVFAPAAVDIAADTLTITSHGLTTDEPIRFANVGGTAFGVLGSAIPLYPELSVLAFYAIVLDANTIQLAVVAGGGAIDISSIGTGDHYMFAIPKALHTIMHQAFATTKGDTIPAGSLFVTLAGYYMSTKGGTFTGAVTRLGDAAEEVDRTGALANADATGVVITTKDFWHCPDVTANRTIQLAEPTKAGQKSRISRTLHANAFAALFTRASDASTIGRLNAVGGLMLESYDSGDGKGITWHAIGLGGADLVS